MELTDIKKNLPLISATNMHRWRNRLTVLPAQDVHAVPEDGGEEMAGSVDLVAGEGLKGVSLVGGGKGEVEEEVM